MTALSQYEKIEAVGTWRADAAAQRRDVIVTLGDASLTMLDMQDRAVAHWSIPAIARANPGQMPAIYHPDGDPDETLELSDDAEMMIDAIETLRQAVARRRPKPGRLRWTTAIVMTAGIAALGYFWLPGAVQKQTQAVLPEIKRQEIGALITRAAERYTAAPCRDPVPDRALATLSARLFPERRPRILVVPDGLSDVVALPGNRFLVGRALVEDYETPEVLAGYLLSADIQSKGPDALLTDVLSHASVLENLRLLTSGEMPQAVAERYAEDILTQDRAPITDDRILARFQQVGISARPYAYALDVTGETTLSLIEADAAIEMQTRPILSDGAWVALQGICEF